MSESLPRVLVLSSAPFNQTFNNGQTLSALFSSWPSDQLSQVFVQSSQAVEPDWPVCSNYWKITRAGLIQDLIHPRSRVLQRTQTLSESVPPARMMHFLIQQGQSFLMSPPGRFLHELAFQMPSFCTNPLITWVKEQKPDVIYVLVDRLHLMRLALQLSRATGVPIVPHITDDWIHTPDQIAGIRRPLRQKWREVLSSSKVRMTIGKCMAKEYQGRYGGDFLAFAKPAFVSDFPLRDFDPTPPKNLLYCGGLHVNRWQTLQRLARAAQLESCQLYIYAPESDLRLYRRDLESSGAILHSRLHQSKIPKLLQEAGINCLVESFEPASVRYTRLSFSTKIAETLLAARPILVSAPPEHCELRRLVEDRLAFGANSDSIDDLRLAIRRIRAQPEESRAVALKARQRGMEEYEAGSVLPRFIDAIRSACDS